MPRKKQEMSGSLYYITHRAAALWAEAVTRLKAGDEGALAGSLVDRALLDSDTPRELREEALKIHAADLSKLDRSPL